MKSVLMPRALCIGAMLLCAANGPPPVVAQAVEAKPPAMPPKIVPITARHHGVRRKSRQPVSPVVRHVAAATAAATQEPKSDAFLNAVQVFPWSDGALYHVYTAPEQVTDIALQPGEVLGAVAAGDTVRWVIGDATSGSGDTKRTHVLVKPFTAGLTTNIVITTDRRSYHLALTSTAHTAMTALSWTYPADQLIALKKAAEQAQAAAPVSSGIAVEQLHFNYAISGDHPVWRPLRAFDDGQQTFIEFPASLVVSEAPPLFLVDAKGEVALVNYRVAGHFYVVDRIFDAAELRLGTKHQDIVRITRGAETAARRRGA